MGREGGSKGKKWLPELGIGLFLTLLPWLLDKFEAFERLAPPIGRFLSTERTVATWLLLTACVLILLLMIFSLRLALAYLALDSQPALGRHAPPPPPAPTPSPRFSEGERRVIQLLRSAQDRMSGDQISRTLVPEGLTGPQVLAALHALQGEGLVSSTFTYPRVNQRALTYMLTQKGFNVAEKLLLPPP